MLVPPMIASGAMALEAFSIRSLSPNACSAAIRSPETAPTRRTYSSVWPLRSNNSCSIFLRASSICWSLASFSLANSDFLMSFNATCCSNIALFFSASFFASASIAARFTVRVFNTLFFSSFFSRAEVTALSCTTPRLASSVRLMLTSSRSAAATINVALKVLCWASTRSFAISLFSILTSRTSTS